MYCSVPLFREKEKYQGRKVTVGGWVRSNRDSKNFGFLVVNDGTFFEPLQIVYSSEMPGFAEAAKIGVGAAVVATGTIVETPGAKQPFEMQAEEVLVEGASPADYPLQKKRHSFEYLRTISHLRPRTNTFQAAVSYTHLDVYKRQGQQRLCAWRRAACFYGESPHRTGLL